MQVLGRRVKNINFGYWPRNIELHVGRTTVEPVRNFESTIAAIRESDRVVNGWFYPPLVPESERGEQKRIIYARQYSLPPTHTLSLPHSSTADSLGEFLIALLGMLEGLRLVRQEWVHFYRTAVKSHALSDLDCTRNELEAVLAAGEIFWKDTTPKIRRLMFGAIHWRLFSESYEHEFERFAGQYTVLDTCCKVLEELRPKWWQKWKRWKKVPRLPHAAMARLLAKQLRIPVPSWARTRKSRSKGKKSDYCKLSRLRNRLIHEGLYGKKPIGFSFPRNLKPSIDLGLRAFNTRAILAILGVRCQYTRTSCESRCYFALDIDGQKRRRGFLCHPAWKNVHFRDYAREERNN